MKRILGFVIAAVFACALTQPRALAQDENAGTWTVVPSAKSGTVELELRSRQDAAQRWDNRNTATVSLARLGLSQGDVDGATAPRAFALKSDAGAFSFSGSLGEGVGAGHYTFHPNAAFNAHLSKRGIGDVSDRKLQGAVVCDLTIAYIDTMAAAGYPSKNFSDLIAFRALDITADSARRLRASFGDLDARQLIEVAAMKVTPEYAASLRGAGISDLDVRRLVEFKALNIDADYIRGLRSQGYADISPREIVEFKALHIDAAYIRRMERHGFKHLSASQLVELKASGI